jgi:hypothetical protein
MPPRATAALSFYEFVWFQGSMFRVPTQIFPPPWHYYWELLSVHCDRKLIIILDIWWIAFIKVPFFFFWIARWPINFPLPKKKKERKEKERRENFLKSWKEFLSSLVNLPLSISSRGPRSSEKKVEGNYRSELTVSSLLLPQKRSQGGAKSQPMGLSEKTLSFTYSTTSYFITMSGSTYSHR